MLRITPSRLAAQHFLDGMRAGQLEALAETATEVIVPAGRRLISDGDYAGQFWLIESGSVALDVVMPGNGRVVVGRVGMGGLVGWSWLLPPYRWAFGAVCLTEVTAFQFDAVAVRALCAVDPALGAELARRLLPVVAGRLLATRSRLLVSPGDAEIHPGSSEI